MVDINLVLYCLSQISVTGPQSEESENKEQAAKPTAAIKKGKSNDIWSSKVSIL